MYGSFLQNVIYKNYKKTRKYKIIREHSNAIIQRYSKQITKRKKNQQQ